MIFHLPIKIDINLHSGSQIRPLRMEDKIHNCEEFTVKVYKMRDLK